MFRTSIYDRRFLCRFSVFLGFSLAFSWGVYACQRWGAARRGFFLGLPRGFCACFFSTMPIDGLEVWVIYTTTIGFGFGCVWWCTSYLTVQYFFLFRATCLLV